MFMRPVLTPEQKRLEEEEKAWARQHLGDPVFTSEPSPLDWWYRLTSPEPPAVDASFAKRELARRGRLASTIIFFLCIVLLGVLPIGIFGPNHVIIPSVTFMLGLIIVALIYNRRGHSNVTGVIVTFGTNLALFTVILSSPGGLSASSLGLFDLLVFSELFVASLLPANWIVVAAAVNIIFIVTDLLTQHRNPAFAQLMITDAYPIIVRPIALHIVVSVVLWLWVRSAMQAMARADRAGEIARLIHVIARQEHAVAKQKHQLDFSIQQIVETHMRVANGDFSARVPLTHDNVLWQIAGSLNNLLVRIQRLRQFEQEMNTILPQFQRLHQESQDLQKLKDTISFVTAVIRKSRLERYPIQLTRSGTQLDLLITEINALNQSALNQPPPSQPPLLPQRFVTPPLSGNISKKEHPQL